MTKASNPTTKTDKDKANFLSYLTGAYLFFIYMEASMRWPAFEAIRFHFVYGLILTVLCGFTFISNKKEATSKINRFHSERDFSRGLVNTTFLLLAILGIYSVLSMARSISIDTYIDNVVKSAFISFFIVTSVKNIKDLKVIIFFILLAWFKLGSEGFTGWLTGSQMWESQGVQRLHGNLKMGHPNSFSAFAMGCIPFSYYLFNSTKKKLFKGFLLTIFIFSIIILIFTASRSGYVSVLLVVLYLFFKMKKNKLKIFLFSLMLGVVLSPLIPEQYYERFESIYTGKEKEGNSSGTRIKIMEDAYEMYKTYPLGVGVQAFSTVRYEMFGRSQNIHMLYIEVLTNIGPIGLIVFLVFIYRILSLNRKIINTLEIHKIENNSDRTLLYLTSMSKAIIMFILLRMVFGLFAMDLYEVHWWLMLGLTLACNKLLYLYYKKQDNN